MGVVKVGIGRPAVDGFLNIGVNRRSPRPGKNNPPVFAPPPPLAGPVVSMAEPQPALLAAEAALPPRPVVG